MTDKSAFGFSHERSLYFAVLAELLRRRKAGAVSPSTEDTFTRFLEMLWEDIPDEDRGASLDACIEALKERFA